MVSSAPLMGMIRNEWRRKLREHLKASMELLGQHPEDLWPHDEPLCHALAKWLLENGKE